MADILNIVSCASKLAFLASLGRKLFLTANMNEASKAYRDVHKRILKLLAIIKEVY